MQYRCANERRRQAVLAHGSLNGIDYLEVLDREAPEGSQPQQTLLVRLLKPFAAELSAANVQIEGGVRARVGVVWAVRARDIDSLLLPLPERTFFDSLPEPESLLLVRTDSSGDYSAYRLCLVAGEGSGPPQDFDPLLSCVDFSFKVECPNPFDCATELLCPPERFPEPRIDYLARDYAGFRRLMLDRLAQMLPAWTERSPADLGIVLVEVLAHAADQLSYYQDSVATEAYLGTARRRVSLRRHTRLLDYAMHEGCSARAWVHLRVEVAELDLAAATPLLTRLPGQPARIAPDDLAQALRQRPLVFETLHEIRLRAAHNRLSFYTWGAQECCLPKGATRATLRADGDAGPPQLAPGDVLVFEEVLGPASELVVDADPAKRHMVRLTESVPGEDPLGGRFRDDPSDDAVAVIEIAWDPADALPFPLCISALVGGAPIDDISVARGNIVLAEQGRTVAGEQLAPPAAGERYLPQLAAPGLVFRVPYDERAQELPAAAALTQDPRAALPALTLRDADGLWAPMRDLLGSDPFARHVVVEMHEDRLAQLRFSDGVAGQRPQSALTATYRVGSGPAGNVGAEAIAHIVSTQDGISQVRNPLPAQGGTEPEPLEQVRQYAPQAFRIQQRAVTAADYAAVAERHPEVQKAAATRRWTGSWHTMFLTVDRRGGQPVDPDFEETIRRFMERFRLAGHDLEIEAPRFVALDIALVICVAPGYFRDRVQRALLEVFSSVDLPDGRRGVFHPDNFTFGQPVYLSQVVATAMGVPGVAGVLELDIGPGLPRPLPPPLFSALQMVLAMQGVRRTRFQRWGRQPRGELAAGVIELGRLEIARLDNDPSRPENGLLEFIMEGGQ